MNSSIRGLEGVQSRIAEIQSKLATLEGRKSQQFSLSADSKKPSLKGSFSNAYDQALGNEPLSPFSGATLSPTGAIGQSGSIDPNILQLVHASAEKYGIDPALFRNLVQQESSFNPRAISSAGALGLAQLMPKTAESLGVTNPFDPAQNLDGGAKYLSQLLKQFNNNRELALAAYNAGPGAVTRAGGIPPIPETQNYVKKILANLDSGN